MRFPVKLNRSGWPKLLASVLPSAPDARVLCREETSDDAHAEAMSSLKFGATFKTTARVRFPLSLAAMAAIQFERPPRILDVGASDGSTSLDIMQVIPFESYYITDRNILAFVQVLGNVTWFYDEDCASILAVSNHWVAYPDINGAFFPLDDWSRRIFSKAPRCAATARSVQLIAPAVRRIADDRVVVRRHDMFELWTENKVDLVVAANILNRSYFSDQEIQRALRTLLAALSDGGYLAVIDNRKIERATIFRVSEHGMSPEISINGGTDIASLALGIMNGPDQIATHDD